MTLDELVAKMRPFHNHICMLYDTELVRLIGIGEDDRDFYYIVREHVGVDAPKKEYWTTAVGHCYSLKGLIPAERYAQTEWCFTHNAAPPTDEFLVVPHDPSG